MLICALHHTWHPPGQATWLSSVYTVGPGLQEEDKSCGPWTQACVFYTSVAASLETFTSSHCASISQFECGDSKSIHMESCCELSPGDGAVFSHSDHAAVD